VTAVTSSAERGARLRELGAEAVVPAVADAAGPFDVALESVGGPSLAAAVAALAPGGLALWYGQASRQPATLDFFALVGSQPGARIEAFSYYLTPHARPTDLADLVGFVAAGRLHPEIGVLADWHDTARVLTDLRQRKIRGKAVLRIT
jgi:NADPH:quinone reductase-like Zn-dependent oxidoreductase